MGGYDFPGSNSGTDLHALTGWIPERIPLADWSDAHWLRAWQGLHSGKALLSVATGQISAADADRAGLVPSHAYAVLDLREVGLCFSCILKCLANLLIPFLDQRGTACQTQKSVGSGVVERQLLTH